MLFSRLNFRHPSVKWAGKGRHIFMRYSFLLPLPTLVLAFHCCHWVGLFACHRSHALFMEHFWSMQMPLPVCARESVCVRKTGPGRRKSRLLSAALSRSLAHSPAATFALAQSNGERSNQTIRGPHSSSYLSPLLLLFEPGWVCLQWKNIRQPRRTPILLRIDPL